MMAFLLSFSLLITACGGATTPVADDSTPDTTGDEEVVKIGLIQPLTGDVASIGQDMKMAVELFLEENPVWAGKKVELVAEDGQCNGQQAASAAQKLINVDQVDIILGAGCSGETLAAAPVAEKAGVLLYTSLSTSPEVSGVGKYTFRGAPSDDLSTTMMTDLLKEDGFTKVALISQNNDFSQAYRLGLQSKLPDAGIEIVVDEAFNSGTTDFKSILQKVKDSEAEALLNIPGEITPAGFINKQARELGIELPVYGPDVLSGEEFFEVAKDSAEGSTIVITAADRTRDDVEAMLTKFEAMKGAPSSAEAYVLLQYDAASIVKMAVEEVGFDVDAIVEYLENMDPYQGLGGVTDFDENHDGNIYPNVMVAQDGKFVIKK